MLVELLPLLVEGVNVSQLTHLQVVYGSSGYEMQEMRIYFDGRVRYVVLSSNKKQKKIENSIGLVLSKPSEVYWHLIDGLSDSLRSKGHHIHELD